MSTEKPPYITAYGNIAKALNKIKKAQTLARFTQAFLSISWVSRAGVLNHSYLSSKGGVCWAATASPLIDMRDSGIPSTRVKLWLRPLWRGIGHCTK